MSNESADMGRFLFGKSDGTRLIVLFSKFTLYRSSYVFISSALPGHSSYFVIKCVVENAYTCAGGRRSHFI